MATGRAPSSRPWQESDTRASDPLVTSGETSPPSYYPGNTLPALAWQSDDTPKLPSLRRSSDFHLEASNPPSNWPPQQQLSAQDRLVLPPIDTSQGDPFPRRGSHLTNIQHVPMKRRRIDEGESQDSQPDRVSPPTSLADSPGLLGTRGQVSPQVPNRTFASHRRDTVPNLLAIGRAWESQTRQAIINAECCQPGCQGPSCTKLRSVVQKLISEVCFRDPLSSAASASGVQPPAQILPDSEEIGTAEALEWALQRLQWNNSSLKNLLPSQIIVTASGAPLSFHQSSPPEGMKRRNDEADKEADMLSRRPSRSFQPSSGALQLFTSQSDETWRHFEAMDPPGPQPRHGRSASFSYGLSYGAQQSPTQGAQSAMMLPSPSSLNLPMPPNFPSMPSPSPFTQGSAHATHLQDLQHQVSVKTLALQTLQREYDALIQKIERSRIRTQALEKKFEVSDAEIKSLSEEKEKLAGQVQSLEAQIEGLQQARDDARRMGAESAAQYMKIVEMAGQLQAQGIDSKKNWEREKGELLDRIKALEIGAERSTQHGESSMTAQSQVPIPPLAGPSSWRDVVDSPAPDQPAADEAQMRALRERNEALEGALKAAKEESKSVREAALALAGAGKRIENSLDKALGDQEGQ